ncbi:MAG: pyridine nucleotide-disulfide oxidoreductase, partial [Clostridia bacterium]|nr:pyridine nucleotide-disulfide oxidoreductase [Clostridia bacterium]
GIYACGNALHVNDLVDYVSESGETAGGNASLPNKERKLVPVEVKGKIMYIVPQMLDLNSPLDKVITYFRASEDLTGQKLTVKVGGQTVFNKSYLKLLPPEMERVVIDYSKADLSSGRIVISLEDK